MKISICRSKINSTKHGFEVLGKIALGVLAVSMIFSIGFLIHLNVNDTLLQNWLQDSDLTDVMPSWAFTLFMIISVFGGMISWLIILLFYGGYIISYFRKIIQFEVNENC